MAKRKPAIVVDTSVLFVQPQPYRIPELREYGNVEFVVPPVVLWELDRLMEQRDRRDRARAAIHVLEGFVGRGAAKRSVSCGTGLTLRVAHVVEESRADDGLDRSLADDRILACCMGLARRQRVILASCDFALHAKALTLGLESIYLKQLEGPAAEVSSRDVARFSTAWRRVEIADNPSSLCRRALIFLNTPLCKRLLSLVRESGEPPMLARFVRQFDEFAKRWLANESLTVLLKEVFGLDVPSAPDYRVKLVTVPGLPWRPGLTLQQQQSQQRPESEEERAARIRAEERVYQRGEELVADSLLFSIEAIREHILEQIGDRVEPT